MDRKKVSRHDLLRLARARVFTTRDLARMVGTSPAHAAKLAFDLKKRGFLTPVRRGVYASVPLDADPKGFRPDPFLAAHKALGEGYTFSHLSALALLGGEQSARRTVDVSAPGVRPRRRNLGNLVLHVHSASKGSFVGRTVRVRRGGDSLPVTGPEQTLVDLASMPSRRQDYESDLEAFRTLLPRSNPKRLLAAVLAARSPSDLARVGHLLRASGELSPELADVVGSIRHAVARAGPAYFATRPKARANRFDREFKLVYPGGR
jgi:hypothetical protein